MSRCYDWMKRLTEDPGALDDESFLEHVKECRQCALLASHLKEARESVSFLKRDELSMEERDRLFRDIREKAERRRSEPASRSVAPRLVWAASLIFLILLGGLLFRAEVPSEKESPINLVGSPETRCIEVLIQVDSKPRIYCFIEASSEDPDTEKRGG